MTRKFTFLLMALMALAGFKSWGQETLTVCDGTSTEQIVPVFINYFDTQGTISQYVIPSSDIAAMTGKEISAMKFYISYTNSDDLGSVLSSAKVTCKLQEVSSPVVSSIQSGGTTVFSGNLTTSNNELDCLFDTPYTYQGGNLLISFEVSDDGSFAWTIFYGINPEYNSAITNKGSDPDVPQAFIPKTTFTYASTNKKTLTINESSSNYNDCVPFQGYNADGLTKSQFIIPAASLTALEGADITALDFYTTTSGYNVGPADYTFNGSWDVYFKIVDYVIMPYSYESSDGMDKVYTGNMVISNNKMTLTFDEPYTYEGGNLMIYFNQTQRTSYKSTYWRGVTTSEYAARAGYTGSYGSDNANYYFLPTTTFTYIPGSTTEYTVNLHVNGVVTEETITSMPAAPTAPAGLTFCGWTTSDITTYVTDAPTYVTSLSDEITDLYAVFKYSEFVLSENATWVKMNNASDLNAGDEIVLVYNNLVMCTRENAFYEDYPVADVTISNSEITYLPENAAQFTLIANNGYWNLEYNELGATRILATNSSNNELAPKDLYELWYPTYMSIDFTATTNGNSVLFYNSDTYMYIRYRSDWNQITTSNGSSTTYACQAYKKYIPVITTNYYMTEVLTEGTVANATFKNIIVVNPITVSGRLEMNANGLFRNENVANFVFANGAEFYYTGEETVLATFQKSITGYTNTNDHYYLIANPTDNETVANLVNEDDYDLYTFDGAADLEWINMKSSSVVANDGIGYLYANSSNVILGFAGEIIPAGSTDINLNYANKEFGGFNLIGNPFACNAYANGENFYKIAGTELSVSTGTVAPCEGIFVQATAAGQIVTLTTEAPVAAPNALCLTISQNRGEAIDRAIVRFDECNDLHKFMLNPAHTNLSITKGGETFAAISSDAEGELPVNFKAEKDGTYTISVNTENVDAEYLHLIDNMTGMDTDLLSTPSYTFNATTSDYASRFKLVFGVKNDNEEMSQANSFAYISNGEIVISNEGRATLQLIDVMGRIISSEEINGEARISTEGMTAGVYVLNLNGNVQKIVVR